MSRTPNTGSLILTVKWSAMIVALLWTLVYRLSEESSRLPEFVYVNF